VEDGGELDNFFSGGRIILSGVIDGSSPLERILYKSSIESIPSPIEVSAP
jgi:hypothetical protein